MLLSTRASVAGTSEDGPQAFRASAATTPGTTPSSRSVAAFSCGAKVFQGLQGDTRSGDDAQVIT